MDYLKLREKVRESYFSCLQENVVKWTLFDNTAQTRGEMSTFIAFASVLQETVSKGSVAFISRLFMVSNSLMELPFFPLFFFGKHSVLWNSQVFNVYSLSKDWMLFMLLLLEDNIDFQSHWSRAISIPYPIHQRINI